MRPYPDDLTRGHEYKKALRSSRSGEIIAQLLAVTLDMLRAGVDVGFPVNNEVNQSDRLIRNRVCYALAGC